MTPFAQKKIDEERNNLLERQADLQPSTSLSSSSFLMLHDDDAVNTSGLVVRADLEASSAKTPTRIIKDEVEQYKLIENPGINCDVLKWWQEHEKELPLLSRLARSILAIPASSAATESNFSTAGYVLSPRRSQLNQDLL